MREIKFRIWYKRVKTMSLNLDIWNLPDIDGLDEDEEPILMQFTGLKDKNGKEIFEGDIIKDTLGILNVVKFDNGEFYFIINEENSLKLAKLLDKGKKLREYEPEEWKWHDCEVIGNKFENPELLK